MKIQQLFFWFYKSKRLLQLFVFFFPLFLSTWSLKISANESPKTNSNNQHTNPLIHLQSIIRGKVVDVQQAPIAGVNISVVGSNETTTTNQDGTFEIKASIGAELLITSVGYENVKIKIEDFDEILVPMNAITELLDEAVVVGFGKQKKSSVVSSIATVKGSDITFPTRNLTNNLAGQLPGLIAIQRSGEPGYDNSEFWIRGISSFYV